MVHGARITKVEDVSLPRKFRNELEEVLNSQITVENIELFANRVMEALVSFVGRVVSACHFEMTLSQPEQEELACARFGLPCISEMLDRAEEKRAEIKRLGVLIQEITHNIGIVITPPDQLEQESLIRGGTPYKERELIPRQLCLLYIFQHDLEIKIEDVSIERGTVDPEMIRNEPYVRFEVPELQRVVYICDEEGNVSYVFDTSQLKQYSISIEELDLCTKDQKNSLIKNYPAIGVRVVQSPAWRDNICQFMSHPITQKLTAGVSKAKPEFERYKFLGWDDFREAVRSLYIESSCVKNWYDKEKKNHTDWPVAPDQYYREWTGWPELVGKENRCKRRILKWSNFEVAVRKLYPGSGSINAWYQLEYKKHSGWPSNPHREYKEWKGWPEIVGIENRYKRTYLSWEDFLKEVRALYPGSVYGGPWYREEQKKHQQTWHNEPDRYYKEWTGWAELVEKETPEFLPWDKLVKEVRRLYPGKENVSLWYKEEQKKYMNWHSNPSNFYKEWKSWPEFGGKEKK